MHVETPQCRYTMMMKCVIQYYIIHPYFVCLLTSFSQLSLRKHSFTYVPNSCNYYSPPIGITWIYTLQPWAREQPHLYMWMKLARLFSTSCTCNTRIWDPINMSWNAFSFNTIFVNMTFNLVPFASNTNLNMGFEHQEVEELASNWRWWSIPTCEKKSDLRLWYNLMQIQKWLGKNSAMMLDSTAYVHTTHMW